MELPPTHNRRFQIRNRNPRYVIYSCHHAILDGGLTLGHYFLIENKVWRDYATATIHDIQQQQPVQQATSRHHYITLHTFLMSKKKMIFTTLIR